MTKDVGHEIDDEELQEMIHMFDTNHDGVIDKASLTRMDMGPCKH